MASTAPSKQHPIREVTSTFVGVVTVVELVLN